MIKQVVEESNSMLKHSLSQGMRVSSDITENLYALRTKYVNALQDDEAPIVDQVILTPEDVNKLATIHQKLAKIISPATPKTIALLYSEERNNGKFRFLGPVALIRQLSFLSLFFIVVLLAIASSVDVTSDNINKGFFGSNGYVMLLNQTFLLCCAGIGGAFSALFTANKFIADGTYDPKYDSSYWSSIILGFMAGIIIVELLPSDIFAGEESPLKNFGKPAFALLGGFSANMLYRLLKRLVDTVDHLVRGEPTQIKMAESKATKAQLANEQSQMKANQSVDLLKLSNELGKSNDIESCKQQINKMIEKNMSTSELPGS